MAKTMDRAASGTYELGVETNCDMCAGKGWSWQMVGKDNRPFMTTSDPPTHAEDVAYQRWAKKAKRAKATCTTCNGSGVLPEHLKPGYWQARGYRAQEMRKPSVFWPTFFRNVERLLFGG